MMMMMTMRPSEPDLQDPRDSKLQFSPGQPTTRSGEKIYAQWPGQKEPGIHKMKMPLATCGRLDFATALARRPLYLSRLITKICVKS